MFDFFLKRRKLTLIEVKALVLPNGRLAKFKVMNCSKNASTRPPSYADVCRRAAASRLPRRPGRGASPEGVWRAARLHALRHAWDGGCCYRITSAASLGNDCGVFSAQLAQCLHVGGDDRGFRTCWRLLFLTHRENRR